MSLTQYATSTYRQIAATGATRIGLLIVVLDSLAEDLRVAGAAAARHDVAGRCKASHHAFLLLGYLESWAAESEEIELRSSLLDFYSYLRASIIALQIIDTEPPFQEVAQHVTSLRVTWQTKETQLRQAQRSAHLLHDSEPNSLQPRWSG